MRKQNLVIIHSFPGNSHLLKGFYAFLSDYFQVYAIDLPGFVPDKKPLQEISFDHYARHVEAQIDRWKLKDYFLGGISFGFAVANHCQVNVQCKGFLALEPFINQDYIKADLKHINLMKTILAFVTNLHIHERTYHNTYFKKFVLALYPTVKFDIVQNTVDPYTFFETANMLLHHREHPSFHQKPYVLVINEADTTVHGPKIIKLFETLDKVLILKTTIQHNPVNPSKAYFEHHIKPSDMQKIVHFMGT